MAEQNSIFVFDLREMRRQRFPYIYFPYCIAFFFLSKIDVIFMMLLHKINFIWKTEKLHVNDLKSISL